MTEEEFAEHLAAAIVAQGDAFGVALPAKYAVFPPVKLSSGPSVHCYVVPAGYESSAEHPGRVRELTISVGILAKLSMPASGKEGEFDLGDYPATTASLIRWLEREDDEEAPGYQPPDGWTLYAISNSPKFRPDHLQNFRQYTAIVSATFQQHGD